MLTDAAHPTRYVCHLDASSLSSKDATSLAQQTVFATPLERKLPRIRLRTRQAPSLLDQKILISIDAWPPHSRYPEGHFVRALGKVESKEAEQESLLLEYEVPYRPFGRAIMNCLPVEGENWVVPPKEEGNLIWRDREDLRDLLICSIDPVGKSFRRSAPLERCLTLSRPPSGCQDIDDALHARPLPNGNIEAGVRKSKRSFAVVAYLAKILTRRMQTLPMSHTSCTRTTRWMPRQLREVPQYT
jgi:exosome complex exonuclease DIS3/RRP44